MVIFIIIAIVVVIAAAGTAYYLYAPNRGSVFERAMNMASQGKYTDARGLVRSRVDRDPDDIKAQFALSRIYSLEHNEESELHHLQEIKRIGRFQPGIEGVTVLNRIGEILYKQEKYRESYESFQMANSFAPKNEESLAYLSFLALGQAEFEMADSFLRTLMQTAPNVVEYRLARGIGLSMLKRNEAMQELETALIMNPHDTTSQFLFALQAFKIGNAKKSGEEIAKLIKSPSDPEIMHITNRLATAVMYMNNKYDQALVHAERCLANAISENWVEEEYDARLSVAYMAMLIGDLEKANDNLLELEIRNPSDEIVLRVSDFRMDIEEGVSTIDRVSSRGFDFSLHMQDWLRNRFADDAIYQLSGLKMDATFEIPGLHQGDGAYRMQSAPDPNQMIEAFNELKGPAFLEACQKIMSIAGYTMDKSLPYRDRDGADFIANDNEDKKNTALFRIRQWSNQPISDIFLRNMQNTMNELKVNAGYVVAGARLTTGAETALANLKKITVINEYEFGEILAKVMD